MDIVILFLFLLFVNAIFLNKITAYYPILSRRLLSNLFYYHLIFFGIYYATTIFSRSDSIMYYIKASEIGSYFDIFSETGTSFIDNFAAIFVQFGLSYESLMLLFSYFGYIGFVFAYLFFRENIPINVYR